MHSDAHGRHVSFFPTADAAVLQTKHSPPSPGSRPVIVAPIFDTEHADVPLRPYMSDFVRDVYPTKVDALTPAPIPPRPADLGQCGADRYLFPVLTRNERLRLTMLFYYTKGALEDLELQSRLLEKVHLASETVGWEFGIVGLLNHNTYTRMATVGLPLAVLPRRESTCAHTVNQPPGKVFLLPNLIEDWRFEHSPHVEVAGLRAYAGVPLRFETEFGEHVAFGSLCVASNSPQSPLSQAQQQTLARLATWIVDDIIQSARLRRQRERRRMLELLGEAERQCAKGVNMAEYIPTMLQTKYPTASIQVFQTTTGEIVLDDGTTFQTADLENGLWEDTEYFDHVIEERNQGDMVAPRAVRVIAIQCASQRTPTFLLVASKDFRDVYDDIDSWFVTMCASLLCRSWQGQALREALAAKETFLRGITHQLRTPIHGILGTVELLTEELKSQDLVRPPQSGALSGPASPTATSGVEMLDPHGYLKIIRTSAKELMSTVNSLIKLNRWTDVAQAERMSAFYPIRDIEAALLDDASPALSEDVSTKPSVVFCHDYPPSLDLLFIDLPLFVDCIQPLIVNAIQHTAGGVVAVTLSYSTDSNRLVVDVQDNGRGISREDHERIFAAYDKVDIQTTGAGLGLTLACKSANLMNGTISLVSSEIGKGSYFRATFDDITSASSFPPLHLLKRRLVHLPPTFHRAAPFSPFPSLGTVLSNFLGFHGYTASESIEGSLVLFEYTEDRGKVLDQIQRLPPNQVALCLVPDSMTSCSIDFQQSRVQRRDNVVYVRAPLLLGTLEHALNQADAALADIMSSSKENGKPDVNGDSEGTHDAPLESALVNGRPDMQHRSSVFQPSIETDIVKSISRLDIGIQPPEPLLDPQKPSLKPMTLLVDDNAVNLRILEIYCKRRIIPFQSAKDGEEAISAFARHRAAPAPACDSLVQQDHGKTIQSPFELILMDLQMPVCDGITATRRIRDLERENGWERSTIIIVTGQDSPGDRTDAEEAGADGFLVKPVGPKILDRWIKWWFPGADVG